MRIVTLIENTSIDPTFTAEHGLSLYLETEDKKILFDMGQTDAFAVNGQQMGLNLAEVDFAVLSHGHYDHGGGLRTFLQYNSNAPVYIHKSAYGEYYNGTQKYIGLDPSLSEAPRIVFTEATQLLTPDMLLSDCNHLPWKYVSFGLNRKDGAKFLPDDFRHEQYLLITEGEKRILISGCSHKGILNIAECFHPHVLIGGFHLNKVEEECKLQKIAQRLLATGTRYYTGHCTGSKQFAILKGVLGEQLQAISAGSVIEL